MRRTRSATLLWIFLLAGGRSYRRAAQQPAGPGRPGVPGATSPSRWASRWSCPLEGISAVFRGDAGHRRRARAVRRPQPRGGGAARGRHHAAAHPRRRQPGDPPDHGLPAAPEAVQAEIENLLEGYTGVQIRRVGARLYLEGGVASEQQQRRVQQIAGLYQGQVESLVSIDPTIVERRINVRLDLYFVEFSHQFAAQGGHLVAGLHRRQRAGDAGASTRPSTPSRRSAWAVGAAGASSSRAAR
jgi:hypothetical protein